MDEQEQTPITEAIDTEAIDAEVGADDSTEPVIDANDIDEVEFAASESEPTKRRRFSKSFATAALAGIVGLGIGAGAVALAGSIGDGHHRGDRQMGWDHHDDNDRGQHDMGGHMQDRNDGN